ncbi:MAG: diacylglycerol/polyprenol kinase family protein [Patescibacteria group bacterium]
MRFQSEKVKIVRKTWHILAGLFFPIIYLYLTKPQIIILVGAVFLTFLTLEGLRLRNPKLNRWFIKKIGNYLKDKERKNLTSNTFYVASALLAVIFFDKPIAIAALVFFAIGDAMAEIIGLKFGSYRFWHNRSIEGTLAFLVSSILAGILLLQTDLNITFPVMISGAIGATLIEAVSLPIDDNFTIALFSGLVMSMASLVF